VFVLVFMLQPQNMTELMLDRTGVIRIEPSLEANDRRRFVGRYIERSDPQVRMATRQIIVCGNPDVPVGVIRKLKSQVDVGCPFIDVGFCKLLLLGGHVQQGNFYDRLLWP